MCGKEKIHQGVTGAAESYEEIGEGLDWTILFEGLTPELRISRSCWLGRQTHDLLQVRKDTTLPVPLGTGDPYPPVAAVQDSGQGRGKVRPKIPHDIFAVPL